MEVEWLFQIGDNIFYPMQGAGQIKSIEEKDILGKKQQYYIIEMSANDMQLMIPATKVSDSNIRPVIDMSALESIIQIFQDGESEASLSWEQRFKANKEKIKTGEIQSSAEVVRDLTRINKEKALNPSEKKMLIEAHKFLMSELELVSGITEDQMNYFLLY